MCLTNCQAQTFFRFGHGNEVDMVRHQAVSPNCHVALPTPFCHQGKIRLLVFIPEYPISVISASHFPMRLANMRQ